MHHPKTLEIHAVLKGRMFLLSDFLEEKYQVREINVPIAVVVETPRRLVLADPVHVFEEKDDIGKVNPPVAVQILIGPVLVGIGGGWIPSDAVSGSSSHVSGGSIDPRERARDDQNRGVDGPGTITITEGTGDLGGRGVERFEWVDGPGTITIAERTGSLGGRGVERFEWVDGPGTITIAEGTGDLGGRGVERFEWVDSGGTP
jgi:hypothetical protein